MQTLQSQIILCGKAQRVLVGTLLLSVVSFYVFGYRPLTRELASLLSQGQARERQVEANRRQAQARNEIAAKNHRLRLELDRIKKPSKQEELPQLVKDLTLAGQQSSLGKFNYKPGVPTRSELFFEFPLAISFEGDFANVFQFLRTTEDMQRLLRIKSVSLKVKDPKQGQVQAQMAVNIYFSID